MTPTEVRKLVDYDPKTGEFTWRVRDIRPEWANARSDKGWNIRLAGKPVARRVHRHGHLQMGIFGKNYMVHRIAWMHFYGELPAGAIDHINGDPADNRIANLRIATQSQNMMNAKRRKDNSSGIKGVSWSKKSKKWYAYITVGQKMRSLGRYTSLLDAIIARRDGERSLHGEFARVT